VTGAGFLLPFGRRHWLLGHPVPPGACAPLAIGLPRRQQAARTRAGFPCSARMRHGWGRVPSLPRGRRCHHGHGVPPGRRLPPRNGWSLSPRCSNPSRDVFNNGASARVHWHSPLPAFPSPVVPGRNRDPRAFPWAPHPAGQDPAAHARAGTGLALPGITSSASLTSSDALTHRERHHVAQALEIPFGEFLIRVRGRHRRIQPDARHPVQHPIREPHPRQPPVPGDDLRPRVPPRRIHRGRQPLIRPPPARAIPASVRHAVGTDATSPNSSA